MALGAKRVGGLSGKECARNEVKKIEPEKKDKTCKVSRKHQSWLRLKKAERNLAAAHTPATQSGRYFRR